ncbi:MAG: hypothetical protein JO089_05610 [Alphaproteobacteria bacterium]|nr:hypothetical protein [Alphaproteobacteria bacterium]
MNREAEEFERNTGLPIGSISRAYIIPDSPYIVYDTKDPIARAQKLEKEITAWCASLADAYSMLRGEKVLSAALSALPACKERLQETVNGESRKLQETLMQIIRASPELGAVSYDQANPGEAQVALQGISFGYNPSDIDYFIANEHRAAAANHGVLPDPEDPVWESKGVNPTLHRQKEIARRAGHEMHWIASAETLHIIDEHLERQARRAEGKRSVLLDSFRIGGI